MLHYFLTDYWTKRRSAPSLRSRPHPIYQQQPTSLSCPPQPQPPAEITRSTSWESWTSSLSSLSDWHLEKQSWSFKDDYVSFPSLAEELIPPMSGGVEDNVNHTYGTAK